MNEEERLTLNNYIEDLYQAMQIGDIVFEPKNSSELYNLINKLLQENQQLKEKIQQKEDIINKAKEYNNQIIKDTKEFYRPTSDLIYSGDCLIDLAEQNIKILDNKGE